MEKELFALLRLGLGNSTPEKENLSDFIMMSAEQWSSLGSKALEQGVIGIVLDSIEPLDVTHYGPIRSLSTQQKLEWIGQVMQIEQENRHQIAVMKDLAKKWINKGCRVMVMKGQANSLMYPHPEHRSPGDIDCFLFGKYQIGNNIAKAVGAVVDESWYKHSAIQYQNETFENHRCLVLTREGKRGKRLQKELEEALAVDEWEKYPDSEICLPPIQWNAMFLTCHSFGHFMKEGLRLKQVLDWAMFIQREQDSVDWGKYYDFCDRYHLRVFAEAIIAICVHYLGVKVYNPSISTQSDYAEMILHSVFYDDDYIYNAGEGKWKGRLHLIRNLFKYRWKYEYIYQQSVWQQLWWYVSGFVFRTE